MLGENSICYEAFKFLFHARQFFKHLSNWLSLGHFFSSFSVVIEFLYKRKRRKQQAETHHWPRFLLSVFETLSNFPDKFAEKKIESKVL